LLVEEVEVKELLVVLLGLLIFEQHGREGMLEQVEAEQREAVAQQMVLI
jgi:hypothetical protein